MYILLGYPNACIVAEHESTDRDRKKERLAAMSHVDVGVAGLDVLFRFHQPFLTARGSSTSFTS